MNIKIKEEKIVYYRLTFESTEVNIISINC